MMKNNLSAEDEQYFYDELRARESAPQPRDFTQLNEESEQSGRPLVAVFHGLTKSQLDKKAACIVATVCESGGARIVAEAVAGMEAFAKSIRGAKGFEDAVRAELALHGGKYQSVSGAKLEAAETGVSYDYSHNPEWVELDRQAKAIAEQKKALEDRLKKIPAGKVLVDEETGETLIGPAKSSKSSYKVTLAK